MTKELALDRDTYIMQASNRDSVSLKNSLSLTAEVQSVDRLAHASISAVFSTNVTFPVFLLVVEGGHVTSPPVLQRFNTAGHIFTH